ncbi:MAG: D-alanyl-D-alanine carboxypeptidase [Ruminococcaceae bacterium]|nr:D-alanyl-D-alanine carboxypeptidase [Oscillospiraceae bacterium]
MKINVLIKFIAVFLVVSIASVAVPVKAVDFSVSAAGYALINADTLEILASGNAHKRMSMASTTKLMTALILAEQRTPFKEIVTTAEMVTVEGSSMGLKVGDTVSYYALLVGMMLPSGNDAANTAAICVAGSIENFAVLMNKRAAEIGMVNTNFVTPSGLDNEDHYSTAYDMALLAVEFLKNDMLRKIVASESIDVSFGNPPYNRRLYNHNKLLRTYEYCIGMKTGFTKKSGRCLVSAAEKEGRRVVAVTLNAPSDWSDHEKLLTFGLDNTELVDLSYNFLDDTMPVVGSYAGRIRIDSEEFYCTCTDASKDKITANLYLKPFVYAPVKIGQTVGRVDYIYGGRVIHSSRVFSVADLDADKPDAKVSGSFKKNFKKILSYMV